MLELPFFTKPFAAIDEKDLRELVEVMRVREHLQLDYKFGAYGHGREDTIEMLADISAMANASGGYILLGVEEDETQNDGTPKRLVGIENGDQETNWMQSVCESSIDEKIIGLRLRDVPLNNGKSCVLVYIPNSLRKPHMIKYKKHYSFRMRNGRTKRFLDMQEIRNMILNMNEYQGTLRHFLNERRQAAKLQSENAAWILLMGTPIYVGTDKIDPISNSEFSGLLLNPPRRVDPRFEGVRIPSPARPRLKGIESTLSPHGSTAIEMFARLFRNGHFEYGEKLYIPPSNQQQVVNISIDAYRTTVLLINFLDTMFQMMQVGSITEPVAVTVHWSNIMSAYLDLGSNYFYRDVYSWPENELTIELTVNELSNSHNIAQHLMNRIFNAFGREECPYFDRDGNFVQKRGL